MTSHDEQIVRAIRVAEIIALQREGLPLSAEEESLLQDWLRQGNEPLYRSLNTPKQINQSLKELESFRDEDRINAILNSAQRSVIRIRRRQHWVRYAALLLLIVGAAVFAYVLLQPAPGNNTYAENIVPATSHATLTLSNGSTVNLQNMKVNDSRSEGQTNIVKVNESMIAYGDGNSASIPELFNTISTPRGATFSVAFPDGSRAWLNAETTITYPVSFKNSRRIRVKGEVYFEVAPDKNLPFIVTLESGWQAEVTGTRFNIRSYTAGEKIFATLLDGALQVKQPETKNQPTLLIAGQTAELLPDTSPLVIHADTGKVMAWREGFFNFEEGKFEESMREISRWYNVDVVYEDKIPDVALSGQIDRQMKFTELLRFLEKAGVSLKMERERRLVISAR